MEKPKMKISEQAVQSIIPDTVDLRHSLHMRPEIALNEHNTRKRLQAFFGDRFPERPPLLETDLIFEIPGVNRKRIIAFRADMDALPITETSGVSWCSVNSGFAHSCGHDGHMAILAATARIIADSGQAPPCSLRFIFQPGEEVVAAGRDLADAGAYTDVHAAYALHGWPLLPLGSVSVTDGVAFAASHHFTATFIGKGGHGAYPEKCINPLTARRRILHGAQQFPFEQVSKEHGEVVSCGCITGGSGTNVIPDRANAGREPFDFSIPEEA